MDEHVKDRLAIMLTGGGARAAYQLGVLKYIFTELKCVPESPIFIGTSAGAINAFFLTLKAHEGFDQAILQLCDLWGSLKIDKVFKTDAWSLIKVFGNFVYNFTLGRYTRQRHVESLLDTTPLYLLLRKVFEEDAQYLRQNIESGLVRALGLSAMQYGTGKTVTFFESSPGSGVKEWDRPRRAGRETKLRLKHVLASASLPFLFPSIKLENSYYADGSVRATAPLSSAIQLGATKILVVHIRRKTREYLTPLASYPSVSQIVGMIFNTIFMDPLDFDLAVLNRINALLDKIPPHEHRLKKITADVISPSVDLGQLALPFQSEIPKTLSFLIQGLGPAVSSGADFLSYILFEGHYAKALIDQGFKDAHAYKNELLKFFSTIPLKKAA